MTEDQIEKKKKYAGEKKNSMHRRDINHDYCERCIYMVSLEVEGRMPVFGQLEGNPLVENCEEDEPRIVLSELGEIVQNEWMGIHGYYPEIEVLQVQMMPDHMHGILFVKTPMKVHLGHVINGFKTGCRKALRALKKRGESTILAAAQPPLTKKSTFYPHPPSPQVAVVPPQLIPDCLFSKGFNDLILRSYDELSTWKNYLRDNPRRLLLKRAVPELLRPFFGIKIGRNTFSGIGNRNLLKAPKRMSVRVSRRLTDQEINNEVRRYLQEAKRGVVLVSPAISKGEKKVMRAVFDAGFPTIVIMENGFTSMSKPKGEQFYACANGLLLMLSPWEHHNERKPLTSEQCRQMNCIALDICEYNA